MFLALPTQSARIATALALVFADCGGATVHADSGAGNHQRHHEINVDMPDPEQQALGSAGITSGLIRCNSRQTWNPSLRAQAKSTAAEILAGLEAQGIPIEAAKAETAHHLVTDAVMWRMVLGTLVDGDYNNLGVVPLQGVAQADGRPVVLFRAGFTPAPATPGSCYSSLVSAGGVRHVLDLYAGPMPTQGLEAEERATVQAAGGTYLNARDQAGMASEWREDLREDASAENREAAMAAVAELIRTALLQPGGHGPRGNLLVHCGGGMHRTGMVVGVIEKCLNAASLNTIADHYRRHVGWHSPERPGGFEQANLDFIAGFDCRLLSPPSARPEANRSDRDGPPPAGQPNLARDSANHGDR